MSKKIFWIVGLVVICIVGVIVLTDVDQKSVVLDLEGQPFLGEESAPVDIIEFGDYKCPSCKDFNDNLFPIINKEVVEMGKAKFYFLNYSFINIDSNRSAQFAETVYQELGNEKFWSFHELLFRKQPDDLSYEKVDLYTESFLEEVLAEVATKEEANKVIKAFGEKMGKEAWEKDMKLANDLGVSSTPTNFIDGKQFNGETLNDFTQMVEEATTSGK